MVAGPAAGGRFVLADKDRLVQPEQGLGRRTGRTDDLYKRAAEELQRWLPLLTKHVDAYVMERRAIKGCEFTSH